jgi:hypothetical protein
MPTDLRHQAGGHRSRLSPVMGGERNSLSDASIFDRTRRAANAASLVWVLPLLTASPIWNRHCQMSGSAVAVTAYWTPL